MRFESHSFLWLAAAFGLSLCLFHRAWAQNGSTAAPSLARLGVNLAGPADWATELPFVDVFRTARPWISQKERAGWGQGPRVGEFRSGLRTSGDGCNAD